MKVLCAWCGATLRDAADASLPDQPMSHGICAACLEFALENRGRPLDEFLDRMPAPVLLVDENVVAISENAAAREFLGKTREQIDGALGGDIVECAYARLPGGCGHTVHCAGCQIRASVTRTFQTGQALLRVEAYNDVDTEEGVQRHRLLISTERVKNAVLLRIDRYVAHPEPAAPQETARC